MSRVDPAHTDAAADDVLMITLLLQIPMLMPTPMLLPRRPSLLMVASLPLMLLLLFHETFELNMEIENLNIS